MTGPGNIPSQAGFKLWIFPSRGGKKKFPKQNKKIASDLTSYWNIVSEGTSLPSSSVHC